jgi:hypothetical protein
MMSAVFSKTLVRMIAEEALHADSSPSFDVAKRQCPVAVTAPGRERMALLWCVPYFV